MIWLVMMSLAQPLAAPQMVQKFGTTQECVNAALNANNVGNQIGPQDWQKHAPNGKFFLCMKPVYPT